MRESVQQYIKHHHLLGEEQPVLVGVSGGMDSMALLHVLHDLGHAVHIAHVNYQLRGEESDDDEALVQAYALERNIPCNVLKVDRELKEGPVGRSFQEKAREVRYAFFEALAYKLEIVCVAVAHHQDDQAETVLLKLVKGSGMEGIAGMRPSRILSPGSDIQLIRPLLDQPRTTIRAYASKKEVPWREDASNATDAYKRNVVRNQVFPILKKHFGDAVTANLARSASIFQGYWEQSLVTELESRYRHSCPGPDLIGIDALKKQPDVWKNRIMLEFMYKRMPDMDVSFHMVEALVDLLDAQVGRRVMLPAGTVWREREYLLFTPAVSVSPEAVEFRVPEKGEQSTIAFKGGKLDISVHIEKPESLVVSDPNTIWVDKDALHASILVRTWKEGDRMVPYGMTGHKKISDLLTDAKIPTHQRASNYVLESAGKIVWAVGVRMADPFKVSGTTNEIAKLVFHPIEG